MKEKYHPQKELPFIDLDVIEKPKSNTKFDTQLKGLLNVPPPNKDK
ncbi:MAG: hypothetical protein JSU03_04980 [Bacteroidetes bacterium]|nr:hypothetical protein [Bacteroidota bacterium]